MVCPKKLPGTQIPHNPNDVHCASLLHNVKSENEFAQVGGITLIHATSHTLICEQIPPIAI